MAHFTMEEKSQTELKAEALEFLSAHRKMVLSVLDKEKHPNSSLLLYVTDDDFNIFFGTCTCFGKYKALQADPHVSLAVVEESVDPLKVFDMQGVAEEIPHDKTHETLEWFVSKNDSKYYVKDRDDFVMFKIKPTKARWLDASSGELQMHDLEV